MVFGERALAFEARGYGRLEDFRNLLELVPAPRVVHALTGVDERTLRLDERRCGSIDIGGSRRKFDATGRRVVERARVRHVFVPDIAGNLEEHGTGAPVLRLRECAAQ